MKEFIFNAILFVFFSAVIFIGLMYATSSRVWYVGMHDSQHEGENCNCYERFIERDNK